MLSLYILSVQCAVTCTLRHPYCMLAVLLLLLVLSDCVQFDTDYLTTPAPALLDLPLQTLAIKQQLGSTLCSNLVSLSNCPCLPSRNSNSERRIVLRMYRQN
eukprot:scpid23804/ scgid8629/ 